MNDKRRDTLIQLWQAACQGKALRPSCRVEDGHFVFEITGNRPQWGEVCQAAGVPSHAQESISSNTLTMRWPSHADAIFGADGLLAQRMDNYETRPQQLWMGRLVQRAIEMGIPAVAEAGTGTGKSFAYAAVCMAMGKRLVISTSNKALQMQLYRKDIPFLSTIFPGKKVALVQGKNNYACRAKAEDMVSGALMFDDPALVDWYATTESGNVEEIPFAVDWRILADITADDRCLGKMCERYAECFYYKAKAERQEADVLICNHMLLCMDQMYPASNILPSPDVVVVDEAHKLADYARNALGVEFRLSAIEKAISRAEKYYTTTGEAGNALLAFEREIYTFQRHSREPQIGLLPNQEITSGVELAAALNAAAEDVWPLDALPSDKEQTLAAKDAQAIRTIAANVEAVSSATPDGHVRWIDQSDKDRPSLALAPYDVAQFVGRLAGFYTTDDGEAVQLDHTRCTRCHRTLTADTVAILEGQPYGPDCIQKVDLFGDAERVNLESWLKGEIHIPGKRHCLQCDANYRHSLCFWNEKEAMWECSRKECGFQHKYQIPARKAKTTHLHNGLQSPPVIFTSATLAAPDMSHFLRESGLPYALQMQVDSPFDYKRNALLYIPNGTTPDPGSDAYLTYLIDDLRRLVQASRGGAFLLFTSYRTLNEAVQALRYDFESRGWPVLVQGELPKLEIAKRFREQGSSVLFATKSFFEGVSIDGDALRLVVIDKMPFEAPNPLNTAQEAALTRWAMANGQSQRAAEFYPFNALRVPKMVIELKQGVGRLIRTATDRGVMAILDPRIRVKQYGRQAVLPSMPPARLVASAWDVEQFFEGQRPTIAIPIVPTLPVNGKAASNGNGHQRKEALFVEKKLNRDEDGELWA